MAALTNARISLAASEPGDGFRGGQVQLERVERLRGVQRDFEPPGRELGGRGVVLVVRVEDVVELRHAVLRDEALHGRPVEAVADFEEALGRALVPQVTAIEREPEGMVLAPEQAAQQAVAERDGFVPGLDGRLELQVERRVGQARGGQRERQGGRQEKELTVALP